jgi:hypothetical protein
LEAGPAAAVFDTPVHITVSGLPQGLVTVQGRARDSQGRQWQSAARFRVGPAGMLNLARAVPVSGSYHVADAEGLLRSLSPAFTHNPATQFFMSPTGFTASSPSNLINGAYGGKPGPAWTFHGKLLRTGTPIPVRRIRVPLLLSDGGRDAIWNSAGSATAIVKELKDANDNAPYINLRYPGAGHAFLGQLPYFPNSGYGAHGSFGGTQQANALATEQSWARMINFLNDPWARVKA